MNVLKLMIVQILIGNFAYAACENEAAQYISQKYNVSIIEMRDLGGGRGGQGSPANVEVWLKADDGSTYSVYFFGSHCGTITRDIKWGR